MLNLSDYKSKLALLIAVPSSAVILYLLWKQTKNSTDEYSDYENLITYKSTVIEIKVPGECVGQIIGSEGTHIKELQKTTGARISFKDAKGGGDNQERTLVIRGSAENAYKAEIEIRRIIAEKPVVITEEMLVPKDSCGRIIGKNGTNIRAMCKQSGCKINMAREPILSSDNTIMNKAIISGSVDQILLAKELISEKIREEEIYKKQRRSNDNLKRLTTTHSHSFQEIPRELPNFSSQKPKTCQFLENQTDYEVYISCVVNPKMFWVHIIDENVKLLDNLIDDMNTYYGNRCYDKDFYIDDIKVGDIICAPHNGRGFYRCEILNVKDEVDVDYDEINNNHNDTKIEVYYIDFGDTGTIRKSDARKLLAMYNELPCQAVQCILNGIEMNETNNEKEWSNASITYFEEVTYSCRWKSLNCKVIGWKEAEDEEDGNKMPIVELFDPYRNIDIANELIQKGYAIKSNIITQSF